MGDVRALSMYQPWASLVALGVKGIETRPWTTKYRGRLLIHAAQRKPSLDEMRIVVDNLSAWNAWYGAGLALGAVVASCVLTDCVPMVADYDEVARAYDGPAALEITPNGTLLLYPEWDSALYDEQVRNVSDQAPFGDFAPGRFAWLLGDVKPTTERCPRCWGCGYAAGPEEYVSDGDLCPVCDGDGWLPGTPAPISDRVLPLRGRQGLWVPKWEVAA
jgi:hypothetical protein